MDKKKRNNQAEFDAFYQAMYGKRWEDLKKALQEKPRYHVLDKGYRVPYYLDYGSFLAAQAVEAGTTDYLADFCAAPGGKTLVLAKMLGPKGRLIANERSATRRKRLHAVVSSCLGTHEQERVLITGHDAKKWCLYEKNVFDRILLDVPCSSEKHVLNSHRHLRQWGPKRTKHLALQAFAFLVSGFLCLKPGGSLVYATCTISRLENDEVIGRLLKKYPKQARVKKASCPIGERSQYGNYLLPDVCEGAGPTYFAVIEKGFPQ